MGTDKQTEEIVVAGSEKDSAATIPAETVLDSNSVYDWKTQHTGLMKKLEDRFKKEVHIPIAKQPTTVHCHYAYSSFSIEGKSDSWS